MGIMILFCLSCGVMHKRLSAAATLGFGLLGALCVIIGVLAVAVVRSGPAREVSMV